VTGDKAARSHRRDRTEVRDVDGRKLLAAGVLAGTAVTAALLGRAWGSFSSRRGEALNVAGLQLMLPYVKKWTGIFTSAKPDLVLTIMRLESNFTPTEVNQTERALPGGGAWGVMQVLKTTADGIAQQLRSNGNPEVQKTVKKYDGTGQSVLDPDVGSLFGTYYLDRLAREFNGDFNVVVAAYQAGPGHVKKALAEGKAYDAYLGPLNHQYVAAANKFREQILQYA
jgi:Transglycosylase SLT domain